MKSKILICAVLCATTVFAGTALAASECHVEPFHGTGGSAETKAWVKSGARCSGRIASSGIATLAPGNAPAHGTLTTDGNVTWVYVPTPGYKGHDPFTLLVNFPKRTGQISIDMDVR